MRLSAIAIALLLTGLAAPADASSFFMFSTDSQGLGCGQVNGSVSQILDLHVVMNAGPEGATGARFRITNPDDALVVPMGVTLNTIYVSVGGPDTGIAFSFAGCEANAVIELATLHYMVLGSVDCSEIQIVADPNGETGQPEVSDCAFVVHPAGVANQGYFSTTGNPGCGYSPPPGNPVPADGASNVATSLQSFGWDVDGPHMPCPIPVGTVEVQALYLGTDPNPPLHDPWWSPLDLQPNTTYYWRIVVNNFGFVASSPVWSFTTENPNAVQASTWGAVKALYR